jgi:hypothetical protein
MRLRGIDTIFRKISHKTIKENNNKNPEYIWTPI